MKSMYSADKESFHYQLLEEEKNRPYVCDMNSLKMKTVTDKVTKVHLHCTHQNVNATAVVGLLEKQIHKLSDDKQLYIQNMAQN